MKKLLTVAGLVLTGLAFAPVSKTSASTISVKSGDTLWGYSQKYHVSVQDIAKTNNIEVGKYMMWPGDKINIPDGKAYTGTFNNHFVFQQQNTNTIEDYTKVSSPDSSSVPSQVPASNSTVSSSTVQQQPVTSQQESVSSNASTSNAASSQGSRTMSVTFYDPAVLGSNMGYNGVAANLSVFPKGTVLRITLQDGQVITRTVNDTGGFAYGANGSNQLDIAWPNASIPSYGRGTATVEVIK